MNISEQDTLRQFKAEADTNLFENLHFDSRMKDQVMRSVNAEREQLAFKERSVFKKRSAIKERFLTDWKQWVYVSMAAAITGLIILMSNPILHNDLTQPPKQEEAVTPLIGSPGEDNPSILKGDPNAPLKDSGQTDGTNNPGSIGMNTWLLKTLEEAKVWFGEDLLVPAYTPDRYTLDAIHASGQQEGIAAQVTFSYVSGNKSFAVIQQKQSKPNMLHDFETTDINGIDGFMKISKSDTELQWFAKGDQYTVIGMISKDEALKVARSLK